MFMNVSEILNKATGHVCNASEHKRDINFNPEVTNLTKSEVTLPQNQCRPFSQDLPVVPCV